MYKYLCWICVDASERSRKESSQQTKPNVRKHALPYSIKNYILWIFGVAIAQEDFVLSKEV